MWCQEMEGEGILDEPVESKDEPDANVDEQQPEGTNHYYSGVNILFDFVFSHVAFLYKR